MSGQQDPGTVRRLPDGVAQPARIESRERRQIRVMLCQNADAEFRAGVLVEVQSPEAVYLGEVLERQDLYLVIAMEHTVERAALAEIENVWRKPPGV